MWGKKTYTANIEDYHCQGLNSVTNHQDCKINVQSFASENMASKEGEVLDEGGGSSEVPLYIYM
jgi:hypothetical protein